MPRHIDAPSVSCYASSMFTTADLITTVRRYGSFAERSILDLGWTQAEIDAAVTSGALRRIGSRMGADTIRYLRVP